eukprot:1617064-Rhodomonas_salina.1
MTSAPDSFNLGDGGLGGLVVGGREERVSVGHAFPAHFELRRPDNCRRRLIAAGQVRDPQDIRLT